MGHKPMHIPSHRLGATMSGGDLDVPYQLYEREDKDGIWWVRVEKGEGRPATECEVALWELRCKLVHTLIHHEKKIEDLTQRLRTAQKEAEDDWAPRLP